jgi:hypothetical protein
MHCLPILLSLLSEVINRWIGNCPEFQSQCKIMDKFKGKNKALWGNRLPSIYLVARDKRETEIFSLFINHFVKDRKVEITGDS